MIAFTCTQCGKDFKVKDELAGKKGKCPGCGIPIIVPQTVPTISAPARNDHDQDRTVPPKPRADEQDSLAGADRSEQTNPSPEDAPDPDLWDFLAPAEQADEIGRLGGYRVLKVLGAGGMGVVFRAEDPGLRRLVALKAMLPSLASSKSAKERFLREARSVAALKHPHIVTIYQVGEDRGAPFLAMEFLEGEPLDVRLKREVELPVPEIVRIGREIAKGLAAAHGKGLIHRDIKPANIWLEGAEGHVKILDFGLARAMADQAQLTQSGAIVGTPAYMAPEQASGKPVDHRCDLFSLGCVFYRMCTGDVPFKGNDTLQILSALALETPKEVCAVNRAIPERLSELVMKLLAKDPVERPSSAEEVVAALTNMPTAADTLPGFPAAKKVTPEAATMEAEGKKPATARPGAGKAAAKADKTTIAADQAESEKPSVAKAEKKSARKQAAKAVGARRWLMPAGIAGGGAVVLVLILFFLFRGSGRPVPVAGDGGDAGIAKEKKRIEVAGDGVKQPEKYVTNSIGMKFVWIPPGNFMMGSPQKESQRNPDEMQHKVTLTKGFYMGVYTVTQEEWQAVMGNNPSQGKGAKKLPVEMVSWDDCQEFIKKLREKDKKPYRLLTEAEWEYACRAGTTTPFHFGETISTDQANYDGNTTYGNGKTGVNREKTMPVGSFEANAWGLHDMHGNVFQWCQDWYRDYPQKDVVDPQGPGKGNDHVLRGGSWLNTPQNCRSAYRVRNGPAGRYHNCGVRVCFCLEDGETKIKDKTDLQPKDAPKNVTNSIGMKFAWIPPGSFIMGSPKEEKSREADEIQHKVTLSKGFYMGVYTVTQEEWQTVMGNNPSSFKGEKNLPVEMVSWEDCQAFIKRLREKDNKPYRLPTEAEWEYACRAGTTTPFHFGETISTDQANYEGNYIYGNGKLGVHRLKTMPAGSFPANVWRLHEMHGNVFQWCQDWHGEYPPKDVVDPQGPEKGKDRVLRGGAWITPPQHLRSAYRNWNVPGRQNSWFGLRICFCPD